jgi:hypothetical protein
MNLVRGARCATARMVEQAPSGRQAPTSDSGRWHGCCCSQG